MLYFIHLDDYFMLHVSKVLCNINFHLYLVISNESFLFIFAIKFCNHARSSFKQNALFYNQIMSTIPTI
jgi:hypothetical protein